MEHSIAHSTIVLQGEVRMVIGLLKYSGSVFIYNQCELVYLQCGLQNIDRFSKN